MILLSYIVAVSGASANDAMIPVQYEVVRRAEVRVPISDSVRAATWDSLAVSADEPVHVRLACIVFALSGGPGNCVPASLVPTGQKALDWDAVLEASSIARNTASPEDAAILDAAARRLKTVRLAPSSEEHLFVIRFFEETVSPADARPPLELTLDRDLTTRDVIFAEPLDTGLLQALYPAIAMRYSVNAVVRVTCRIEANLKLLCRDPGVVTASPSEIPGYTDQLMEDLRFSTYQLASTIKLAPKGADGRDVAGRNLSFVVRWSTP